MRTTLVPGCLSLGSRTFGGHKEDTWRTLVSLLDLTHDVTTGFRTIDQKDENAR